MAYKSFRDQFLNCKKNGTIKEEKCCACSQVLLMCYEHGGICQSNKCRDARIKEAEKESLKGPGGYVAF